jgi:hypothetical protein
MRQKCSTHDEEEICVRTPEGKTRLAALGIDKRIILKWIKEVGCMDEAFDLSASR